MIEGVNLRFPYVTPGVWELSQTYRERDGEWLVFVLLEVDATLDAECVI